MAVLTPSLRKFALTAHVTSSVGWLGAVASFLVLALAGLIGRDNQMVRSAYIATELTTWYAIVPLAFASLLTGLVVALGTPWGLFRHYWVLVKFMLTILATNGRRRQQQPRELAASETAAERAPVWIKLLAIAVIGLIMTFIALHLAGSGLGALHHR
jgi:hypothetical protein